MDMYRQDGQPHGQWPSERSSRESDYSEKQPQDHDTATRRSKRSIWRLVRLGCTLVFAIAALVLTLIILVVGRDGDASSELALITVNMTDFARFTPPTIELVSTNDTTASKTRRGVGSWYSDVVSAAGSVETSIETAASGAISAVETAASSVETAAAAAYSSAVDEADEIIKDIGDTLEDIEEAVTGLMDKVLDTIQDELNKWLQETADALDDLDIPEKMTLHLTTFCSSTLENETSSSNSTSLKSSCSQLFSSGGSENFNSTANNGTIFGFQPGYVVSKVLGVFYVPESARDDIRSPIDSAANSVEKLLQTAGNDLSAWSVDLLFMPIVAIYIVAAVLTGLLVLLLLGAALYCLKEGESLPARVYSVFGTLSALAAFFLLLGSVILTVVAFVVYLVGLAVSVAGIELAAGARLKWLSWAAFLLMAVVTGAFKVEEVVADLAFWFKFLATIVNALRGKGGMKEMLRGA